MDLPTGDSFLNLWAIMLNISASQPPIAMSSIIRRLKRSWTSAPSPEVPRAWFEEGSYSIEVAGTAVVAGAVDVAHALEAQRDKVAGASTAGSSQWTAYADGAPAAALGGRGVSTPPNQVLARAREHPDLGTTNAAPAGRAVELVTSSSLDR